MFQNLTLANLLDQCTPNSIYEDYEDGKIWFLLKIDY